VNARTTTKTVTFDQPFSLLGLDEPHPAGTYTVQTDEEPVESLSFLAYRAGCNGDVSAAAPR
jgi:hypothetical protein